MLSRPAPDSTMFALIKTFCAFCTHNDAKFWVSPKKLDHYVGPRDSRRMSYEPIKK